MRSKYGLRSVTAAAVLVVTALSFSGRLPLSFVDQDEPGPITASRVFSNNVKAYAYKNPFQGVFAPANALIEDDDPFVAQDGLLYFHPASTARSIWKTSLGGRTPPKQRHPILHLMQRAEKEWEDKLARQSSTLAEAVLEYRRRYNRPPPAGFDLWWKFCSDNAVGLPDEYDSIMDDLLPFYGLHPDVFRARVDELPSMRSASNSFTYEIKDHQVELSGPGAKAARTLAFAKYLKALEPLLPDVKFTVNLHDGSSQMISGEARARLVEYAKQGKFLTVQESNEKLDPRTNGFRGWAGGCPAESNIRKSLFGSDLKKPSTHSFVSDVMLSSNACSNPDIQTQHGVLLRGAPEAELLYPHFAFTKTSSFSDILVTPIEQFYREVGTDFPWEEKTLNKLIWRGSNTGTAWDKFTRWRSSHRARFMLLANETDRDIELHYSKSDGTVSAAMENIGDFNQRTIDAAFVGGGHCNENDGTCDAIFNLFNFTGYMGTAEQNRHKYIFDMDGNGWSGRFHRLMAGNSAILKSTAMPEWFQKRVMPWYHYIPVKIDYTDLHDILAFFIGDAHGERGRDDLGAKIAQRGKSWTETYWREVDMQAYMLRLLLEYSRLLQRTAEEPDKADYVV